MDLITKSKALRLRSHLDKHLVANDDCTTVRLSRDCITRRSIWIAEPSPGPTGASSVRLKNDSTGLYLAATDVLALLMTGKRVVQAPLFINNKSTMSLIFDWEPIRDVDGGLKIKLKARGAHGKFLRANSGPRPWNNSVTHDAPTTGATKFWTLWDVVPVAPEYEQGKEVKSSPLPFHTDPDSNSYSNTTNTTSSSVASTSDYVRSPHIVPGGVRVFTHEELSQATNTFSQDNILGQGGFGIVYRGILSSGDVAVKKLEIGSLQGEREFVTEINVLSRIHHKNLVSLVGYCVSELERLLVYEYVDNNSLAFHLHDAGNATSVLDWPKRMRIALDAAKGISYLHEECDPKIIHRDIKSANILVHSNFRAKVADFGLAKFVLDDKTHVTTIIKGTPGYLDPEFLSSGRFTNKLDVYSFGVVLLELITGRKPAGLVGWASQFLDKALEDVAVETKLIDPKLAYKYDHKEMKFMVACAAVCLRHIPATRPRMSQIVQVLEGNISLEKLKAETARK